MAIIHYPGYITKEEAAARKRIGVRAINNQIRKKTIQSITIDGHTFIKDTQPSTAPVPPIALSTLKWVYRMGREHGLTSDLIYEQIIRGNITGVVVANRVFVIPDEPSVLTFLQAVKKK